MSAATWSAVASAAAAIAALFIAAVTARHATKTYMVIRPVQDPEVDEDLGYCWRWRVANASTAPAMDVCVRAGSRLKQLREPATHDGNDMRVSLDGQPSGYFGAGTHFEEASLVPWVKAEFYLESQVIPDTDRETFLVLSWTETLWWWRGRKARKIELGLTCEGEPGALRYRSRVIDSK